MPLPPIMRSACHAVLETLDPEFRTETYDDTSAKITQILAAFETSGSKDLYAFVRDTWLPAHLTQRSSQ